MVISLVDACLLEIRKGLENGTAAIVRNVHGLPLGLRQRILDVVLMHGTINNPSCLATLSTAEFLMGFTSLNMQSGKTDDHEFLDRVVTSLASASPNGQQVGATFEELHLNVYTSKYIPDDYYGVGNLKVVLELALNLQSIFRLISVCRNLATLELRMVGLHWQDQFDKREATDLQHRRGLLNEGDLPPRCLSVIENLKELSASGFQSVSLFCNDYPMLEFKCLTSLQLIKCRVDGDAFHELLNSVRETLTSLRLEDAEVVGYVPWVLPFPLPYLNSLALIGDFGLWQQRPEVFVENLMGCPQLEKIELEMNCFMAVDESHLLSLTRLRANLSVSLRLPSWVDADAIFESPSSFRHVGSLAGNITEFRLEIFGGWDPRIPAATTHLFEACWNLTAFTFYVTTAETWSGEVLRGLANALAPLFANKERAAKLRDLALGGPWNPLILDLIFENCTNLDFFRVLRCPQLNDYHLSGWGGRGLILKDLYVSDCANVSDDGVIPILINSGNKLERFCFYPPVGAPCRVTNRTWMTLIGHCRRIKTANIPAEFEELANSKCFNKVDPYKNVY